MHAASASMAIFLFFCIVFTANLLRIPFYLDYKEFEMNIVILTPFIDKVLWTFSGLVFSVLLFALFLKKRLKGSRAISSVLVVAAYAFALMSNFDVFGTVAFMIGGLVFFSFSFLQTKFVFGNRKNMIVLVILYGMLLLLLIEVASLGRWVYHMFSPSLVFSDESWTIAFAETQISSILYPVLPAILIIFIFSWIGETVIKGFFAKDQGAHSKPEGNYVETKIKFIKPSLLVILVSVSAALFLGYYQSVVAGSFNSGFPGTDVPYYIQQLMEMKNFGFLDAIISVSKNDRFLYLVFQYSCFPGLGLSQKFFVTFVTPVLLTLFLMFSSFLFVRLGHSQFYAVTTMLATASSYAVTVGVYAGFFANWFALSWVYIFYGLLVTILKGNRNPFLLLSAGFVSVAVLLTHPWTWVLLVITLLVSYLLITFMFALKRKDGLRSYAWEFKFVLILLVVNVLVFYVRQFLRTGGGGGLVDGYTDVAATTFSLFNAFKLRYFLDEVFNWYVGGFYAYAPMMVLAILGVFSITEYEDRFNRLMLVWILIGSSMVFLEFPWHARFLYDMPFNVYAAFGILFLSEKMRKFVEATEMKRLAPLVFWTFYILSFLFLFNYAVRCMVLKQFGPSGLTIQP
jgi:hypothetical protein